MIRRDDYKAIKRMNREQMDKYLNRVYMRGYNAGKDSVAAHVTQALPDSSAAGNDEPAQREEQHE